MSNIIPFSFENSNVRVLDKDGEPWFVASDIATVLDIANIRQNLEALDEDEADVCKIYVSSENGVEQQRDVRIINESGLYTLIVRSNKPTAKKFRKWVTSEVLPSIRKTGSYSITNPTDVVIYSESPLERCKALMIILEEEAKKQTALLESNKVKDQQISELKPKANYCDTVLQCKDVVGISVIAKDYGKSAIWLNNILTEKKIQYKQGNIWLLYQKYAEMGLTQTKSSVFVDKSNIEHTKVHTYWTQKGRLFIYDLLKQDKILPLIEQE